VHTYYVSNELGPHNWQMIFFHRLTYSPDCTYLWPNQTL